MARVWVATVLNFFLPGAGYLALGRALGAPFLLGAVGLTWVETSLQALDPTLWAIMFGSVFVMNTGFAIDAFRLGKAALGGAK
jgi:hypothetical protein